MGYGDYLWQQFGPLNVYKRDGYGGAELDALGAALDRAEAYLSECLRELLPDEAIADGLETAETMFPLIPAKTLGERRRALETLYQTDNRWTTTADLQQTIIACGIPVNLTETITTKILTVFVTEPITLAQDPVRIAAILKAILPCHTDTRIRFHYYPPESETKRDKEMTLEAMAAMTMGQWAEFMQ